MSENSIKSMLESTLQGLEGIADVNTIVGQAVETRDGTVIIPISKVSVGFVVGGAVDSSNSKDSKERHGNLGGGGGGIGIEPVAFLVVGSDGSVRLMDMEGSSNIAANLLGAVPSLVEGLIDTLSKRKGDKKDEFQDVLENLDDLLN